MSGLATVGLRLSDGRVQTKWRITARPIMDFLGEMQSMTINWQEILTTFVTTVGGGSVLLGAAAWLIKAIVSNRLALDAEKLKIEIKANADTEIERVKAFLMRTSRVHERQLDILGKLYRHLYDAQALFQNMTRGGRMEGEITPEEYAPLVTTAMESARDGLAQGRLFIPRALAQQCDTFFTAVFEGRMDFAHARHPMIDPLQQATFWKSAATRAHQELPKVLQQIEDAARTVIHGERP